MVWATETGTVLGPQALHHSLAYLVRVRDAAVEINVLVLIEELLINLAGSAAAPYCIWAHGKAGARNRSFFGWHGRVFSQAFWSLALYAFTATYFLGDSISLFELLSVHAVNLLRCLTIAVKYSTFTAAELKELDATVLSPPAAQEKLILGGWLVTPDHLLFVELERAITRTNAHLGRGSVVFPDEESRMACLSQISDVLPSYVAFEFCGPDAAACCGCPDAFGDNTTTREAAEKTALSASSAHDPAGCDTCQRMAGPHREAEFLRVLRAHGMGGGSSQRRPTHEEGGAAGTTSSDTDSEGAFPPMQRRPRSASAASVLIDVRHSAPAAQRQRPMAQYLKATTAAHLPASATLYLKAHLPAPALPTLPAKLFAWFIVRRSHAGSDSRLVLIPAALLAIVAALAPVFARGVSIVGAGLEVSGVVALALALEVISLFSFTFSATCFMAIAVLDQTRRLTAAQLAAALLDVNALIATRTHDNQFRNSPDDPEAGAAATPIAAAPMPPVVPWQPLPLDDVAQRARALAWSPQTEQNSSGSSPANNPKVAAATAVTSPEGTARPGLHVAATTGTTTTAAISRALLSPPTSSSHSIGSGSGRDVAQLYGRFPSRYLPEFAHMELHTDDEDGAFRTLLTHASSAATAAPASACVVTSPSIQASWASSFHRRFSLSSATGASGTAGASSSSSVSAAAAAAPPPPPPKASIPAAAYLSDAHFLDRASTAASVAPLATATAKAAPATHRPSRNHPPLRLVNSAANIGGGASAGGVLHAPHIKLLLRADSLRQAEALPPSGPQPQQQTQRQQQQPQPRRHAEHAEAVESVDVEPPLSANVAETLDAEPSARHPRGSSSRSSGGSLGSDDLEAAASPIEFAPTESRKLLLPPLEVSVSAAACCSCGRAGCPACGGASVRRLALQPRHMVSRRVRHSMVRRHALLSAAEVERHVLEPSSRMVSLPLLYPQNLIAWGHVRHAVHDLGRSFHVRIQLFSVFFLAFCAGAVAFLFVLMATGAGSRIETFEALFLATLVQLSFGGMLTLQVVQGARINWVAFGAQGSLAAIEALVFEALTTAASALPPATRERLMTVKKVAAASIDQLRVTDVLYPARVMFLPANVGLLGSLASLTLSGVIAAARTAGNLQLQL